MDDCDTCVIHFEYNQFVTPSTEAEHVLYLLHIQQTPVGFEVFILIRCGTVLLGNRCQAFRGDAVVSSSRVEMSTTKTFEAKTTALS